MISIRPRRHGRRLRPGRPGPLSLPLAGLAAAAGMLLAAVGSAGATTEPPPCPSSNPPNELVLVSGSPQTAQLGKAFQATFQVKLANSNGCPLTGNLAGITVTFVAPGGGASGTFASSGSNLAYVGTDDNGVATAPMFTANHTAGSYGVYAESDYGQARFDLSNTATGLPASIGADGQPTQEATINSQYGQPLQARVRDADGKPVADASVSFAIAVGPTGASASFLGGANQATALTDANGLATSPPLVANGSPGRFTASASTAGVTAAAVFNLTSHAVATKVSATTKEQRATVTTRYPQPLKARVLDASGQPIEGASVTFTLTAAAGGAGASFADGATQATELTDATGQATSPPLVANKTAGSFTAGASTAGNANPARYTLQNLAGAPAKISAGAASGQSTPASSRFPIPLAVTVTDTDGNPVPAATVIFTAPRRGASGRFAAHRLAWNQSAKTGETPTRPHGRRTVRVQTNANGIAIAPAFTANATPGGYIVTATANGLRVAFALINDART
jgi:protocatechuate 3,4-dioxygenase beta subunit